MIGRSCKVVLVGNAGVGKSSIAMRYCKDMFNEFNDSTIGASFTAKSLIHDDEVVRLEIWDTAGQEKYHSLASLYYRNAGAIIIVYDITSKDSYEKTKDWYTELNDDGLADNALIVLVGNKADLHEKRVIPSIVTDVFFKDVYHVETSAKSDEGINSLFDHIVKNVKYKPVQTKITVTQTVKPNTCCNY